MSDETTSESKGGFVYIDLPFGATRWRHFRNALKFHSHIKSVTFTTTDTDNKEAFG